MVRQDRSPYHEQSRKGVVTGFILMSDVKDEIDFEWFGADPGGEC